MASRHVYTRIAITGASSGLGRALSLAWAAPGTQLHLSGRDPARLGETASACAGRGAEVTETLADVTDAAAMARWIAECGLLDLVIANAGISAGPGSRHTESAAQIRAIFATNVEGVFNTVNPAIAAMQTQLPGANGNRGRIAIIGSIAGLIALPGTPSYSAAKAALDFWARGSAPNLAHLGIALTLIRPGFIRTPMTARNPYIMPGLMDAPRAAGIIRRGLEAGRASITFPYWFGVLARIGNLLPKSLFDRVPRKPV